MNKYQFEYTDTFGGEANYSWVKRGSVAMPDLTAYGYDGSRGFTKANKTFEREPVRKVKSRLGLTGIRCKREAYGDIIELRPYGMASVVFINWIED